MALTKISGAVIADGAISADKLGQDVANTYATTVSLAAYATTNEVTAIAAAAAPKITSITITNNSWTALDDTAIGLSGGYIEINGVGFASGIQVLVDGTPASSVTFVNSTKVRAVVGAKSAASYTVYVVNSDGGTGIRVNGLTYSATPTWVTGSTLDAAPVDSAINVQFSATGATSYAVASGSTLPTGLSLAANGSLTGSITGVVAETTYNFSIDAIDAENQESARSFSITITVTPTYRIYTTGYNGPGQLDRGNSTNYYVLGETDWSAAGGRVVDALACNGYNWYEAFGVFLDENNGLYFTGNFGAYKGNLTSGDTNYAGSSSGFEVGTHAVWGANNYACLVHNAGQGSWGVANTTAVYIMYSGYSGPHTVPLEITNTAGEFPVAFTSDQIVDAWCKSDRGSLLLLDDGRVASDYNPWQPNKYGGKYVTILSNATQIAMTENYVLALNADGALYAGYGYGNYGPSHFLGTSVTTNFSFFSVLASNVAQVAAAGNHGYYIKTDGTLWAWGTNYKGECGKMTPTYGGPGIVSSPVQVGVATDWEKVSAGYECGWLKKTGSDQLYVIGHSSYDETSMMVAPSGFPYMADGTTPIYANGTSIPTAVGLYAGSPGTVQYSKKKFRSGKSWTVVLEEA